MKTNILLISAGIDGPASAGMCAARPLTHFHITRCTEKDPPDDNCVLDGPINGQRPAIVFAPTGAIDFAMAKPSPLPPRGHACPADRKHSRSLKKKTDLSWLPLNDNLEGVAVRIPIWECGFCLIKWKHFGNQSVCFAADLFQMGNNSFKIANRCIA